MVPSLYDLSEALERRKNFYFGIQDQRERNDEEQVRLFDLGFFTGSDHAMSRQFHYFLATRLCFPALAHHFRRQICPCKIHSVPAVQMSHRPARVRDARLFIGQARHQSTRSFLIPINVLNGAKRLNGLNDLNGLRYFMAHASLVS